MRRLVVLLVLAMMLAAVLAAPAAHAQTSTASLDKAVRNLNTNGSFATTASARFGHFLEYRFIYTNNGDAEQTGVTITDTIQPRQTFISCNNQCTQNGSTLTWALGTVGAGASLTRTVTVRLDGPFSVGTTEVRNVGVSDSNEEDPISSNETTVTVTAETALGISKSGSMTGARISFNIHYFNSGNGGAVATGVTITDEIPAGSVFVSCSNNCTLSGTTATWNIGTLAPLAQGDVTLTVDPLEAGGCQICNIAAIDSPDQAGGPRSSNQACVRVTSDLAQARSSGAASGAIVKSSALGNLTLPAGDDGAADDTSVDSSQIGVGSANEFDELLSVGDPGPSSLLHADAFRTVTTSTVSSTYPGVVNESVATASNVNILGGTVTATMVRADARAFTSGSTANVLSLGSKITDLWISGVPQAAYQGARIDLPAQAFGPGSYVAIYEEIKSKSLPTGISGGTYTSDITVNMIRVHVTDMPGVGAAEIIVGHASAHAQSPQDIRCGPQAIHSVDAHALVAQLHTDPDLAPTVIGGVEILPEGGTMKQTANGIIRNDIQSETVTTRADGYTSDELGWSFSVSSADIESLCVLPGQFGICTIGATAVRSVATSFSRGTTGERNSDSFTLAQKTEFVGLKIQGTTFSQPIAPNTVVDLPGVGFAILNEQFCDNGGTVASRCSDGTVAGQTGLTVRAIRLVVLSPAAGVPGAELIVAEAHSGALYV